MKPPTSKIRIRRAYDLAADGMSDDVRLDLPIWRYVAMALIFGGGFLGLALLGGGGSIGRLPASVWIISGVIVALFLVPPLLRRWHLRRKRSKDVS